MAIKARELRGLIIKYYPGEAMSSGDTAMSGQMQMLYTVLHDLHHFEQELALHCAIEDNIMLPALRKQQESMARKRDVVGFGEAEELSAREVEILKHIAQGRSNKEIADILCLSTHTVMSHRKNIARKLDIHSTAGLTIYAVVNGIVTL